MEAALRKKLLHLPLAQGLLSQCLAQKATPLLPSLLRLPLPHADSYKTHEVLNIQSLSPREMEPNSWWVSLPWISATTSLTQGERMLSISVKSCLAKREQTWLSIMRYISQINSRTESQPVVLEAETD